MSDKCTVTDGRLVEPCEMLDKMAEAGNPPPGKQRGLYEWRLFDTNTHQRTRSFFGVKTTSAPKGMAFNFCPWCGERIDAPLTQSPKGRAMTSPQNSPCKLGCTTECKAQLHGYSSECPSLPNRAPFTTASAAPTQEPVAEHEHGCMLHYHARAKCSCASPAASTQEQRQWQGLTDAEIEQGRDQTFSINNPFCPCDRKTMLKAARWAEAKMREKNTAPDHAAQWDHGAWLTELARLADLYHAASAAGMGGPRKALMEHASLAGMNWRAAAHLRDTAPDHAALLSRVYESIGEAHDLSLDGNSMMCREFLLTIRFDIDAALKGGAA